MSFVYVIMGVAACGKTTIGVALAEKLNCPFYDGDDYHPEENVAKMSRGIPLNDDDRAPWLERLHQIIGGHLAHGETAVVASSALKRKYRDLLSHGDPRVRFIYLRGDFDLIWRRIAARQDHYMKPSMLHSQFQTLEEPTTEEALWVDIDHDPETIVNNILGCLSGPGVLESPKDSHHQQKRK